MKRKWISIGVLVAGVAMLAVGVIVLVLNLTAEPSKEDAAYLVEVGTWVREGEPGVEWQFTEAGKGTLTTDGHEHDYGFAWVLEGGMLRMQTEWHYTLEDEYEYMLSQEEGMLTLTSEAGKVIMVGQKATDS